MPPNLPLNPAKGWGMNRRNGEGRGKIRNPKAGVPEPRLKRPPGDAVKEVKGRFLGLIYSGLLRFTPVWSGWFGKCGFVGLFVDTLVPIV